MSSCPGCGFVSWQSQQGLGSSCVLQGPLFPLQQLLVNFEWRESFAFPLFGGSRSPQLFLSHLSGAINSPGHKNAALQERLGALGDASLHPVPTPQTSTGTRQLPRQLMENISDKKKEKKNF